MNEGTEIEVTVTEIEFKFLCMWYARTRQMVQLDKNSTELDRRVMRALDMKLLMPVDIEGKH